MLRNKFSFIYNELKATKPLIHCITNPISINQCANAVLAVGASPIMAEHPAEVAEISQNAGGILLNLGNITDARIESVRICAKTAFENNIPFVLDAVGVSCSALRRSLATELISSYTPSVIKGNYSEICTLYNNSHTTNGVDTDLSLSCKHISKIASMLSKQYNCIVLASGKVDIIADKKRIIYIKNGTEQLSAVTGTGCMLGAVCACCLATESGVESVAIACAILGICGQLSKTDAGNGSFMIKLIDNLSTFTEESFNKMIDMEVLTYEEI